MVVQGLLATSVPGYVFLDRGCVVVILDMRLLKSEENKIVHGDGEGREFMQVEPPSNII